MTKLLKSYVDYKGREIDLSDLTDDERGLVAALEKLASTSAEWSEFSNFWMANVAEFYRARGLSSAQIRRTGAFKVGQDLDARMAISAGLARWGDYRDELEGLIRTRFKTRREFCVASGISGDMLSHVLSGRKHLSIDALGTALEKIGYTLRIVPTAHE